MKSEFVHGHNSILADMSSGEHPGSECEDSLPLLICRMPHR